MIETFADRRTERLFNGERGHGFPPSIVERAREKLTAINGATELQELGLLPGNRLKLLTGNRKRQHSIRINNQWRICFEWADGNALKVEVNNHYEK